MSREELFDAAPYGLAPAGKRALLLGALNDLTRHHAERCEPYRRIVEGAFHAADASRIADVPYLPVGIFKTHELRSVPKEEVFKVVASSGTTTGHASRVSLDRSTASLQSKVLARLLADFIGGARLPMLIVDHAPGGGRAINARYAATVGLMPLGRDALFCLAEDMELQRAALAEWMTKHRGSPILVFGFTFVLWKYLLQRVDRGEIDLSRAVMLHTGGWKKLEAEKVDNAAYKAAFQEKTGLSRVHNFYGMAEQVGTVFVECEAGVLHSPAPAEVVVRDERTWEPVEVGGAGVVQCLSALPWSYPGHSLLTEDLGTLLGTDGCRCGRRGTFFRVTGRAPRAELRGCSDTRA